jgi:hypothetical protein
MDFRGYYGFLLLCLLILSACTPAPGPEVIDDPTAVSCNGEVTWSQAIEILNSGQVESVMQAHNLKVSFVLENGCRIWTIEPRIDDIFEEVQKCGDLCARISLGTE